MLGKLKIIISLIIGIPVAMVVCGNYNGLEGLGIQLIALVVLAIILAINGVFSRKEERWQR